MYNEKLVCSTGSLPIRSTTSDKLLEPGVIVGLHYHDELEFIPVYEGCLAITVDGEEFFANSGEVIFVNSGVPHSTRRVIPTSSGLVQFRENDFLNSSITKIIKYSVKFNNLSESKIRIIKSAELFEALVRLLDESENRRPAFETFVRAEIYRILGLLYRSGILLDTEQFFQTKEIQKILPALEYVNKSYAENVTLEDASALLSFDTSYFCRIFKTATGATFTEYLNFVRVCKAEKLLTATQMSIIEISEAVGFSSVSYFNRIFKRIRNQSPSSYRNTEHGNI